MQPILPLPGHDSTVAASARCANMTCNDGTDQTITHIDMAISKNSPAKSLSTPSKVFASVAMTPRITRSLSKRDNDEKFADSEGIFISTLLGTIKIISTKICREKRF